MLYVISLLTPIIIGTIVGILTHSWIWGLVSGWVSLFLSIPFFSLLAGFLYGHPNKYSRKWESIMVRGKRQQAYEPSFGSAKAVPHPKVELISALERIGSLKNQVLEATDAETMALRSCFNVLGLYVQMPHGIVPTSISRLPTDKSGWLLQAAEQRVLSHLDAWKLDGETEWHVVKYKPGAWEKLVGPALKLAEFIPSYVRQPGAVVKKVNVLTGIGTHFQKTGQLTLAFSHQEEQKLEAEGRKANAEMWGD